MNNIATLFLLIELNNRMGKDSKQLEELADVSDETYKALKQAMKNSVDDVMKATIARQG